MTDKPKLIVLTGPTASGKSEAALCLAGLLDGEIVSCDSMQIYRGMDIGTAKPTKEEQAMVCHHMIDIADPTDSFSCADFAAMASEKVRDILNRGKVPILCGGTGLYIDSLLGVHVYAPPVPEALREELAKRDPDDLYRQLAECDPESASVIHKNNVRRVIRALELYLGTGVTKTEWDRRSRETPRPYDARMIVLTFRDRSALFDRTDKRVDQMMEAGLWDEVCRLDLPRDSTAAQAIGYKELYACLDGACSMEEAVEAIKLATRHYVKRQETWMKNRYPDALRLERDSMSAKEIAMIARERYLA